MTIHRHTSHTHKHASTHVIRGTKASHRPHVSRYDILVSAARERHAGKLQQVRAPLHLPSSPCLRLFISSPRSRVRVRAHENILGQLQVPCAASWGSAWACPASCPLPPMPMECAARIPVAVCVCGCAHATARARANAVHTNACGMARRGGAVCMAGPHSTARSGAPCIDFISDASLSIASRSSAARAQPQDATRRSVSSRTARQCQGHGLPPAPPGPGMGRLGDLTLRAAGARGNFRMQRGSIMHGPIAQHARRAHTSARVCAELRRTFGALALRGAALAEDGRHLWRMPAAAPSLLTPCSHHFFLPVFLLPRNLHTSGHHQVERRGDRSDGWHRVEQVGASGPSRQARSDPGKGCRARARAVCALDCVLCSPSCTCGQRPVRAFRNPPPNPVRRHLRRAVSVSSARGAAAQGGAGGGASRNVGCGGAMRARGALGHVWACACIHVLVQALPSLALPAAASSQGAPLMPAGARARLVACPAPQHSTLLSQHVLLSALRAARTRRATWRTTPQRAS